MRRVVLGLLLVILFHPLNVKAQSPYNDSINDVTVPNNVSLNVQNVWPGYIIYSIRETSEGYVCVLARDSEPHQFPVRTITFSNDWVLLDDSGYQSVKPQPTPQPTPQPAPQPTPQPVEPTPVKPPVEEPEKPQKPELPTIPVMPKPEEIETPEPEKPVPTAPPDETPSDEQ